MNKLNRRNGHRSASVTSTPMTQKRNYLGGSRLRSEVN